MSKAKSSASEMWPLASSFALLLFGSFWFGGWTDLFTEITKFFSGEMIQSAGTKDNLMLALPECLVAIVIDLPIAFLSAVVVRKIWRGRESRLEFADFTPTRKKKSASAYFATLFFVITAEELFARWLFLGVLLPIFGGGTTAFYILFLLGNGLWALAHMYNWIEEDPHPMWTLPQFLGGLLLTIVYMKHGFMIALLLHFAMDCLLWCSEKAQEFDLLDVIHIALGVLYVICGYYFLRHPLSDAALWLQSRDTLALPDWTLRDYICLIPIMHGSGAVLFGILGYDQSGADVEESKEEDDGCGCFLFTLGIFIVMSYIAFWICTAISASAPLAAVVIGIWYTRKKKDTSLSAMTRTFWVSVPMMAAVICTLQVLSFWSSMWFLVAISIILLPLELVALIARKR